MTLTVQTPCTAFAGHRRLAAGPLADVALAVKAALEETAAAQHGSVLTFDDTTGRVVDIDTRGSRDDVLARLARAHAAMEAASADAASPDAASPDAASPDTGRAETASANLAGTGAASRQGRRASLASSDAGGTPRGRGRPRLGVIAREVTLLPRHWEWLNAQPGGASVALRKLVEAGMRDRGSRERARREAAYRFMSAMAGDMPGFEEATRALFAADTHAMAGHMAAWPDDIREHALRLAFAEQEH